MYVTCDKCGKHYDDAQCWTICPHYSLDKYAHGDWCQLVVFNLRTDEKTHTNIMRLKEALLAGNMACEFWTGIYWPSTV